MRRLLKIDLAIAAVLLAMMVSLIVLTPGGPHSVPGLTAAIGLAVVQMGCLVWIRRYPEAAMAVAVAVGVPLEVLCPHLGWLGLAGIPLVYFARLRPPRISLYGLLALLAPVPWKVVTSGWRDAAVVTGGVVLSWTLGELPRSATERREAQRRRIVAEERARISRELHDVVAHTVSVIVVQAGAAEDVFDARPERARQALGAIQVAARDALTQLRALTAPLAEQPPAWPGISGDPCARPDRAAEPLAPQPGLSQLDALVAGVQAAGLAVRLRREGTEEADRELPAVVDHSAYRIVQESLTNTLRHAKASQAEVTVRYEPRRLCLEITDDGTGHAPATAGTGTGIVGMRERARLLGGVLDAGRLPGGGFRVRADLPLWTQR